MIKNSQNMIEQAKSSLTQSEIEELEAGLNQAYDSEELADLTEDIKGGKKYTKKRCWGRRQQPLPM